MLQRALLSAQSHAVVPVATPVRSGGGGAGGAAPTATPKNGDAPMAPTILVDESLPDRQADGPTQSLSPTLHESPLPETVPGAPSPAKSAVLQGPSPSTPVAPSVPPSLQASDAEMTAVPDIRDLRAPKPELGKPHLSKAAIYQRSYRVFQPRANGTMKVGKVIFDEWHGKGAPRRTLELIFQQCGWDPATCLKANCTGKLGFRFEATFITEVEVLREEMKESELQIEGEFLTPEDMEERSISECFGLVGDTVF